MIFMWGLHVKTSRLSIFDHFALKIEKGDRIVASTVDAILTFFWKLFSRCQN